MRAFENISHAYQKLFTAMTWTPMMATQVEYLLVIITICQFCPAIEVLAYRK